MKAHLLLVVALVAAFLVAGCDITINPAPCGCPDGAGGAASSASTSGSTGDGGAGGVVASSSSGVAPCPPCGAGLTGDYLLDELCLSSQPIFEDVTACSCSLDGACGSLCLIPSIIPGDGATCPLAVAVGASAECVACLAATTGCSAVVAICMADPGE